jgi:outer membrane protein TolC
MGMVVGTLRVPSWSSGIRSVPATWAAIFALALLPAQSACAQYPYRAIYPEQRQINYREASEFPALPLPPSSPPPTVSAPPTGDTRHFPLDDAIRTALGNSQVIRVLAGVGAVASGRTIYDTAIANAAIDQQLGRFDPFVTVNNTWDRIDLPSAVFNDQTPPIDPLAGSTIVGSPVNRYGLNAAVTKQNPLGGEWQLGVNVTQNRFPGDVLPLNPETRSSTALSYTQPLLQGLGRPANLAPVVLARISTEISFFQLKAAVQSQVRGVVEAYWNLVAARTAVVARQVQVEQLDFAYRRLAAQARLGGGSGADAAQAHVSLAQFRAQLLAAQSDVFQSEAALRNLLGLPPWDEAQLIPTSEPTLDRVRPDWQELVDLAAAQRPDLIELKLILEADEQQRIIANNSALPQLNGVARYRWNGLEGELPSGNGLANAPGQFSDWTLGVNFSVPLGLRQSRALLRQRELILARDRANLEQGLHAVSHALATTVRSLDQAYEQYLAFQEAREAALLNMARQQGEYEVGRAIFLNVLQAITDLGNVITSEAQALTQYNTLLAELELQTGTILETHGIRFYEERYGSIGPLGRLAQPVCYPESTPPSPNYDRYPSGDQAAENVFKLDELRRFRIAPRKSENPPGPGLPPAELPPPPPRGPAVR